MSLDKNLLTGAGRTLKWLLIVTPNGTESQINNSPRAAGWRVGNGRNLVGGQKLINLFE
jgi:hypothetical protein